MQQAKYPQPSRSTARSWPLFVALLAAPGVWTGCIPELKRPTAPDAAADQRAEADLPRPDRAVDLPGDLPPDLLRDLPHDLPADLKVDQQQDTTAGDTTTPVDLAVIEAAPPADAAPKCDGKQTPDASAPCDASTGCTDMCLIGGTWYAAKATPGAGTCKVCDPTFSQHQWAPAKGCVITIAGDGQPGATDGPALSARFKALGGVDVDADHNVYVVDRGGYTIRMLSRGRVTTLAGNGKPGSAVGSALGAVLKDPVDIAVDSSGRVYYSDHGPDQVRRVSCGMVEVVSGIGVGGCMDGKALLASHTAPSGLAWRGAGELFVNGFYCYTIRMLSGGMLTTVAGVKSATGQPAKPGFKDGPAASAMFNRLEGLDVDSKGNLYVADYNNHLIRLVSPGPTRTVSTFAGLVVGVTPQNGNKDGAATSKALLEKPLDVAVDSANNKVYFVDGQCLRMVHNGVVSTLNGSDGTCSYGDVDGKILTARFQGFGGVATDAAGRVYITDDAYRIKVYRP